MAEAGIRTDVGFEPIKATIPIIKRGAVSPMSLARVSIIPVKIPGRAEGNTMLKTTLDLLAPIAKAMSLIILGTDLIELRADTINTGITSKDSVSPPTIEEDLGRCM